MTRYADDMVILCRNAEESAQALGKVQAWMERVYRGEHQKLDSWIRMRLRSIYRKRDRKRGPGRGSDHHRWPNRHFAELRLFRLVTA